MKKIRKCHPESDIYVFYGAIRDGLAPVIEGLVDEYCAEEKDYRTFCHIYTETIDHIPDGIRAGHPSAAAHQKFAEETIEKIKENFNYMAF